MQNIEYIWGIFSFLISFELHFYDWMVLKVKYQKFGVCMILCIWKKSLMLLCSEVSYFFLNVIYVNTFSASLLQTSVSHDPPENVMIW